MEASRLITQINQQIVNDSNLRRIFDLIADNNEDELSEDDVSRYIWLVATFGHAAEGVWIQFEKGLISEKVWKKWELSFSTNLNSPLIRYWWSEARISYSPEFHEHFDVLLRQNDNVKFPSSKSISSAAKAERDV